MTARSSEIGRRIAAARELSGHSQTSMAALPGMAANRMGSKASVGRIEKIGMPPDDTRLGLLAKLLKVPEWFFTADDPFIYGPNSRTAGNDGVLRQVLERIGGVQDGVDRLRDGIFDGMYEAPANNGEEQQYVMQVLRRIEDLLSRLAATGAPPLYLAPPEDVAVDEAEQAEREMPEHPPTETEQPRESDTDEGASEA